MELYIFNRSLEFQGIIDNFTSLRWVRRYFKSGEFELQCALTPESLNLLVKENIIYKKDGNEAGIVEYRNLKEDATGKEILVVKGRFLTGYLNRRIIWGKEILNVTSEVAMRSLVNKNCITPSNADRTIPNLMLGTLNNHIGNVDYQVSYSNLADELENLSNVSNLGHKVTFDTINRKLAFEVYKGLDRSSSQSINPRCVFSKEFENILEQEYTDSLNNYRNVNLVAGSGEGIARNFTTVGNGTGLDRFELFTDARDISKVKTVDDIEVAIPDVDYIPLLINRGNEKLAETYNIKTFDSKINSNSNLKYKVDYDLGDIVTIVSKRWGLVLDTRIPEIEEVYEASGQQINITFGSNVPTIIDKIKSISKNQVGASENSSSTVTIPTIDGGSFL